MKITGVALKIAVPTVVYLMATIYIDFLTFPFFKIWPAFHVQFKVLGILLLFSGIGMVIYLARKIKASFKNGVLLTEGLFRLFRDPMHASYLLLIIPGIAFMFDSWIVLTTVAINFILLRIFIKSEYRYLEDKFGDEYINYVNTIRFKFI